MQKFWREHSVSSLCIQDLHPESYSPYIRLRAKILDNVEFVQ